MSLLRTVWREAWGLFVDDGSLAIGAIVAVAICAVLVRLGLDPRWAALALAAALLAVLVENVGRSARKRGAGPP